MSREATITVEAWESEGILLEKYAYSSGKVQPLPKHSHEEYQFGLSFNCCGEYRYRGACHTIPIGNLSVICSAEVHSPSERTYLSEPATFWMMHLQSKWLLTVASEIAQKTISQPFLLDVSLADRTLNNLFLKLHRATEWHTFKLEQDSAFWNFIVYLITHHVRDYSPTRSLPSSRAAIKRAQDFLHAHYASDVTLEKLAAIAGLSRFHFCRVFHQEIGLSVSAYQTQLRIAQAKRMLVLGTPISLVASITGFYDQSHFGWHFKRLVGVTPKNYVRKRNNFLDRQSGTR